ncbi:MAG: MafI family immunity protein [Pyrinomonadaceae bacterium]
MNLEQIESRLLAILDGFDGYFPAGQLEDMQSLVIAGEPGVALENFCTQLYEYEICVSAATVKELSDLGAAMGIRPDYWSRFVVSD